MKKAILFGAGGQDGYYLSKILERDGVTVYPFSSKECDVGVQGIVYHHIAAINPDFVFNLAAVSTTAHDAIWDNQRAIVNGSLNILEAVRIYCPKSKVWLAGSILQLNRTIASGQNNDTIYAAQRNSSVAFAHYYRRLGIDVYVSYLSYHDSPRRSGKHLAKRLAIEAKEVAAGIKSHIILRDPLDEKEWNCASDMMEAVWAQVNSSIFEAVLGSGSSKTIMQYAKECLKAAGLDNAEALIKQEFTREGPVISKTYDRRFQHHFKTSLSELARMMVA